MNPLSVIGLFWALDSCQYGADVDLLADDDVEFFQHTPSFGAVRCVPSSSPRARPVAVRRGHDGSGLGADPDPSPGIGATSEPLATAEPGSASLRTTLNCTLPLGESTHTVSS